LFFAHVRAAIGSAVQQTDSHRSLFFSRDLLFFSRDLHTLRELYPHREILQDISDDARLIVSEPVGDLPGA